MLRRSFVRKSENPPSAPLRRYTTPSSTARGPLDGSDYRIYTTDDLRATGNSLMTQQPRPRPAELIPGTMQSGPSDPSGASPLLPARHYRVNGQFFIEPLGTGFRVLTRKEFYSQVPR
jgi:hypothetical protein